LTQRTEEVKLFFFLGKFLGESGRVSFIHRRGETRNIGVGYWRKGEEVNEKQEFGMAMNRTW
jgi:hypothetical protein